MASANQPATTITPANRQLRVFILVGLGLAALIVIFVLFFSPQPQPPKLAVYPQAQVLSAGDNGAEFQVDMQANATLKQVVAFYEKEFADKGWTKLNDTVSTNEQHTSTYESKDLEWVATFDAVYQIDRGLVSITIYERKLGK
jgi:predicted exporter